MTTFLLAGRWFEKRSKRRAGEALRALMDLGAKDVASCAAAAEARVPVAGWPSATCSWCAPARRSPPTAWSRAARRRSTPRCSRASRCRSRSGPATRSTGGTVNAGGRLVVRATRVGSDTQLAQMARLVEEAQHGKTEVQRLADRISGGLRARRHRAVRRRRCGFWLLAGADAGFALGTAVAVLIIACPCALGLATPTALLVGTGRGAQLGILIRGPEVLESTRRVDTVVLDKTGTVTHRRMKLVDVVPAAGEAADDVRRLAAAVESGLAAPVAARGRRGPDAGTPLRRSGDFASHDGLATRGSSRGATSSWAGRSCSPSAGWPLPAELATAVDEAEAAGRTAVLAGWDGAGPWRPRRRRHRQADVRRGRATAPRARARAGAADRRPRGRGPGGRRARSASTTVVAGVLPAGKVDEVAATCRRRAGSSRWSATGSTTPRRWPRPTWASRSAPAPTPRWRRPT